LGKSTYIHWFCKILKPENSFSRQSIVIFPVKSTITYLKASFCCIPHQ
jgi:hypothetical protein